ncbi:MAG: hypothetical protein HZB55_24375 [Deltaproteobacteria bacterium]|nr:hypothetical protein [Deltaproteobacteria bacterium]
MRSIEGAPTSGVRRAIQTAAWLAVVVALAATRAANALDLRPCADVDRFFEALAQHPGAADAVFLTPPAEQDRSPAGFGLCVAEFGGSSPRSRSPGIGTCWRASGHVRNFAGLGAILPGGEPTPTRRGCGAEERVLSVDPWMGAGSSWIPADGVEVGMGMQWIPGRVAVGGPDAGSPELRGVSTLTVSW